MRTLGPRDRFASRLVGQDLPAVLVRAHDTALIGLVVAPQRPPTLTRGNPDERQSADMGQSVRPDGGSSHPNRCHLAVHRMADRLHRPAGEHASPAVHWAGVQPRQTEPGLILTASFLRYAAFQVPGGLLADRFGAKATMVVALAGWSVFIGLAGVAWNFASLSVIRALFGSPKAFSPHR